ncbi:glycosyltransferase family 4 protein [Chloroflexota bacterium]
MKLGVFFIGNPRSGGLYQYSLNLLDSLKSRRDDVIIFNMSGEAFPYEKYQGIYKISNTLRLLGFVRRLTERAISRSNSTTGTGTVENGKAGNQTVIRSLSPGDRVLRCLVRLNRVKLNLFTAPTHLSYALDTPFIMPVHDLQHRLNPQFPEVSSGGVGEAREYLYSNAVARAAAILVDSETGRDDVLSLYPADESKVKVLPFTPPNYLNIEYTQEELQKIRKKYNLPPRFLFYPANFWAHKNHKLVIEALKHIKEKYRLEIPVVFIGSREVTHSVFSNIQEMVDRYGLTGQVYYPGYVSGEDVTGLYILADALVMPTFFGPTNIPYLEAFMLGCPVIGSDIRGIREQIGDAGLLVDTDSPPNLAEAIMKMWNDEKLRYELREKGYARIKQWDFQMFSEKINRIIDEIIAVKNL